MPGFGAALFLPGASGRQSEGFGLGLYYNRSCNRPHPPVPQPGDAGVVGGPVPLPGPMTRHCVMGRAGRGAACGAPRAAVAPGHPLLTRPTILIY